MPLQLLNPSVMVQYFKKQTLPSLCVCLLCEEMFTTIESTVTNHFIKDIPTDNIIVVLYLLLTSLALAIVHLALFPLLVYCN